MRFNYNLLNNRIAQVCGSQQEFARRLGISFEELQRKLSNISQFTVGQMKRGILILNIYPSDLNKYFFEEC